jgi:DNA-binding NtrC family response regulator
MLEPEIVMEKGPHTVPALGRKKQLLVVDDDKAIQTLLARDLSSKGYDVALAGNGLEALTLFHENSFDLVLTDLHMPIMDGGRFSRLVKEQSPNTPVIMITGEADSNRFWEKLNMNCVDAIIPKPFQLKEIDTTVQRLLNSGT